MTINFRQPVMADLDQIIAIEQTGFTPEEAATKEAMAERIEVIPDSFVLAVNEDDDILGYVVGPVIAERYLYDDLFSSTVSNPSEGGYVSILSLIVHPDFSGHGIGSKLLQELERQARASKRLGITLTCLEELIPFYERNGYTNEGVSDSTHAGETWYNLVLDLKYHKF